MDLSGKSLLLGSPLRDIGIQDLLLLRLPHSALTGTPDLLFQDLDIPFNPAVHDAGVRDPAADRFLYQSMRKPWAKEMWG